MGDDKDSEPDVEGGGEEGGFNRVLTGTDLTFIGVGSIVGSGIFVMSGQAAALYAGPAVTLSFLFSGLCCIIYAMCFAELASTLPVSGSAYSYTKVAFGRFAGWIIGWALVSEYMFGISVIAVGWSGYFESTCRHVGLPFPAVVSQAPIKVTDDVITWTGSYFNLPAVLLLGFATAVVIVGVRESTRFTTVVVSVKILAIIVFCVCGAFFIDTTNWEPFVPEPKGDQFGQFGWSGVLRASSVIFFAYIGFDAVTTGAAECKDPQRDLPRAIFSSLGIVTVLYCATSLVLTGMISYTLLMVPDPLAVGVDAHPELAWLSPLLKVAVIIGLPSGVVVGVYAQSRIFHIMACDGLLPQAFRELHSTFRTPWIGTVLCGCGGALLSGTLPVNVVGELCSIGTLLAFGTVCAGVIRLRDTQPDTPRPFKVPLSPFLPAVGVVLALVQTCFLPLSTWIRMACWMLLGLLIFFGYGVHQKDEEGYVRVQ